MPRISAAHAESLVPETVSANASRRRTAPWAGKVQRRLGCDQSTARRGSRHVLALLESSFAADTWTQISEVAAERCAQSLLDQSRLLGMAVAALGEAVHGHGADTTSGDRGGVSGASSANARKWRHKPRVVDLSALWAGPLCGSLLAQAGCQVVKVESIPRPQQHRHRRRVRRCSTGTRSRRASIYSLPMIAASSKSASPRGHHHHEREASRLGLLSSRIRLATQAVSCLDRHHGSRIGRAGC